MSAKTIVSSALLATAIATAVASVAYAAPLTKESVAVPPTGVNLVTMPLTNHDTNHDASLVRLRDAINGHDPAAVAACFTEDYRTEVPLHPSRGFTGNQKVRENWTALLARTPDLHAEIQRSTTDGDETWSEWEMRGTATDGTATLFRGVVISGATNGRIAWTRFFLDPVTETQ